MTTTSVAREAQKRTKKGKKDSPRSYSLAGSFSEFLALKREDMGLDKTGDEWPSTEYQKDPVRFAREVLGIEPWDKQSDVLRAAVKYKRVAVKSGHKVSKSNTAAIVALWFFCCFDQARVVMTSVTSRQVDEILWREVHMMHSRARRGIPSGDSALERNPDLTTRDIGGEPMTLARSGLKSPDFREIVGFTAREAEAVAGVSGKHLLYICDEASGIPAAIFEAIEGNRAGGARILLFSNPTRATGEFFEAFHSKKMSKENPTGFFCITISSEDTPNCREGRDVIPGLAGREWVEERKREWGIESPEYKVRVQGEFVLSEEGKIISLHLVKCAEERWHDSATPSTGRLVVSVDPAGPGGQGDESVFVARRGMKVLALVARRALNEEGHFVQLKGMLDEYREEREMPLVVIDREGPVGFGIWKLVQAEASKLPELERFEVKGLRASDAPHRRKDLYGRLRDELWANLAMWLKSGGAIPEDTKLAAELHCPSWNLQVNGVMKATPKDDIRKELKRSPDRADAIALAVWDKGDLVVPLGEQRAKAIEAAGTPDDDDDFYGEPSGIDPYNRPIL